MQVISFIAQKGGAGKTSLCLGAACAASATGVSAVIVDLDPQASATSWGDRRPVSAGPAVLPAQASRLPRLLAATAAQGVEIAFLDTAPGAGPSAVAAATAADLVVVPCRPAVYDVETVQATVELVRAVRPGGPVLCVLNAVPPRGPRAGQARELLTEMGVEVAAAVLGHRAAVDYAATLGLSVQEYEPAGKAAAEIAALSRTLARSLSTLPDPQEA